jgi:hypothetical protein
LTRSAMAKRYNYLAAKGTCAVEHVHIRLLTLPNSGDPSGSALERTEESQGTGLRRSVRDPRFAGHELPKRERSLSTAVCSTTV